MADHIKSIDGGTHTQSYDVRLTSGETGTATRNVASSISQQEFWLKNEQGERKIVVTGNYNPVSRGNTVTVIWYGRLMAAYINHNTRREMIVEPDLNEMAGRPSVGKHLLLVFVIVPVVFAFIITPIRVVGASMGFVGKPIVSLCLLAAGLLYLSAVVWFFIGYPILWLCYSRRRRILEKRINEKIRAVAGY